MSITITRVIGTHDVGIGADEIADVEAYRTELAARIAAAYPDAAHVDVAVENGYSQTRVSGLDPDEWEREGSMVADIGEIANDVWNSGNWHAAA